MQYPVVLIETEEGFSISCPALPGCHSQGATNQEALAAIREAITLWQEVAEEDAQNQLSMNGTSYTRELVTLQATPKLPGISQRDAIRVFEKLDFRVARQIRHIVMSNGRQR